MKPKVSALESKVTSLENKPSSPIPKAYIVETWHNGNNWYRRYSDGFIEQGGKVTSSFYATTVTLSKSYPSSTYTIITYRELPKIGSLQDKRLGDFQGKKI